ncbi:MAG: RNA polymerase sigma factor [Coprobacillus cateniformis]
MVLSISLSYLFTNSITKRTHEDDYNSSMEEYEDEQMNITHEVIHKEVSEYILDIIQAMPTSLRSVCLLRFYEQLSVKEIAEILDVSENAVKLRIRRAKNYIKDELELKGITPGVISSALDPNALLLLFVTCQNLHTLSLTTSKSIAAAITNEVSFTAGATVSTTSLTIATLVTTLAITGGSNHL